MKNKTFFVILLAFSLLISSFSVFTNTASAYTYPNYNNYQNSWIYGHIYDSLSQSELYALYAILGYTPYYPYNPPQPNWPDYYRSDVEIETRTPTDIEEDEAVLRGHVEDDDNSYVRVWFEFSDDEDEVEDDDGQTIRLRRTYREGDTFQTRISKLEEDEKYYYKACGEDRNGNEDCGKIISFRTDDDRRSNSDIEITTRSATEIEDDSAILRGEIEDEGEGDVRVWFEFSDDEDEVEDGDGDKLYVSGHYDDNDDFEKKVYNLDEDEKYYYRACGEDDDGEEDCGSIRSFRTDD